MNRISADTIFTTVPSSQGTCDAASQVSLEAGQKNS